MSFDAEAVSQKKASAVKHKKQNPCSNQETGEGDDILVKKKAAPMVLENVDKMCPDKDLQFSEIRRMNTGMPPIKMNELTAILEGPNMPNQKVMKEVADKLKVKDKENESDDGSACSNDIKGLFDTILEVSLLQSDSEDDLDEDEEKSVAREVPCAFCKRKFMSTMSLKTHTLMAHSQEDSSISNLEAVQYRRNLLRTKRRAHSLTLTNQLVKKLKKYDQASAAESIQGDLMARRQSLEASSAQRKANINDLIEEQNKQKQNNSVASPATALTISKDARKVSSVRSSPRNKSNSSKSDKEKTNVEPDTPKEAQNTQKLSSRKPGNNVSSQSATQMNVISKNKSEGTSERTSSQSKATKRRHSKDQEVVKAPKQNVQLRRSSRRQQDKN